MRLSSWVQSTDRAEQCTKRAQRAYCVRTAKARLVHLGRCRLVSAVGSELKHEVLGAVEASNTGCVRITSKVALLSALERAVQARGHATIGSEMAPNQKVRISLNRFQQTSKFRL